MNKQRLQQNQKLKLSPKQIQFLGLLQIPLTSLESRIEEELEKNPALEEEIIEEEESDSLQEQSYYKRNNPDFLPPPIPEKEQTLYDSLLKQLSLLNLDEREYDLAEYLIGYLDDNGYLTRDLYIIENDLLLNQDLEVLEKELEKVLQKIQTLEPKGIGARNLKECLILQLLAKEQTNVIKNTIDVLQNFYDPFSKKNFKAILRNSEITERQLKTVYLEVGKLNPNPGSLFSNSAEITNYIIPDFSVSDYNGKLNLKLNKSNNRQVFVNKQYEKMLVETKDKDTKDFIKQKIESAQWFVDAIKQRENTLQNVMLAILEFQHDYFTSGDEKDLKPMILMDIAQKVNMDISTISRVSNSKYVETFFGTFLLKELFSEAYRKEDGTEISNKEIKKTLKEILETEDKKQPLNDEKLATLLGKQEYHIARRTVAKYREQLHIPVARLRRVL
ncbi:MAG: RNA polymerase factor sigma-54 [Flavobacteriales bacterium]|nr:RNA polymerase factor sigma-54 [Flavobacteriales bacterium]